VGENNFSLIDLKALSVPATKLIEVISNATGVLYEPKKLETKLNLRLRQKLF